jgi:hypothetical protein
MTILTAKIGNLHNTAHEDLATELLAGYGACAFMQRGLGVPAGEEILKRWERTGGEHRAK